MKRTLLIMALATMMFVGCSDKADLTPAQVEFFKAMGEKISYMKPDTTVVLATTTAFEIKNHDIMESVYRACAVMPQLSKVLTPLALNRLSCKLLH